MLSASPTYGDSFEPAAASKTSSSARACTETRLNESIQSESGAGFNVTRTPKVLAAAAAASRYGASASSVEIDEELDSSQRARSVTFSTRKRGIRPAPVKDDDEVLTEDEYSEDFDDTADVGVASSASYVEDFEPDSMGHSGDGGFRRRGGMLSATSSGAYSEDFEHERSAGKASSRRRGTATAPLQSLDELLSKLSSSKRLPAQVAELRTQVGLQLAGAVGPEQEAKRRQLEAALEQLEIDMVLSERARRRSELNATAARAEKQRRATQRRAAHEAELRAAEAARADLERRLAVVDSRREDLEAHLAAAQSARDSAHAARAELAAAAVLRQAEVDTLKKRCAKIASEAGAAAALQRAGEADRDRVHQRRELEVAVLRQAIAASDRRHEASLTRLPEFERRRVAKEDDRLDRLRQEVDADKAALATERQVAKAELEAMRRQIDDEHEKARRRLQNEHDEIKRALQAAKDIADDTARRERERLAVHSANLDSERAAVVRDRAQCDVAKARLAEERVEFLRRRAALEPRFAEAEAGEARAKKAAEETEVKTKHLERLAERLRREREDLQKRETAIDYEAHRSIERHRRATDLERAARDERDILVHKANDLEKTRFSVLTQQAALARHVVAMRHASSFRKPETSVAVREQHQQPAVVSPTTAPPPQYHRQQQPIEGGDGDEDWPALPPPPAFDRAPPAEYATAPPPPGMMEPPPPEFARALAPPPRVPSMMIMEAAPEASPFAMMPRHHAQRDDDPAPPTSKNTSAIRMAMDDLPEAGMFSKAAAALDRIGAAAFYSPNPLEEIYE